METIETGVVAERRIAGPRPSGALKALRTAVVGGSQYTLYALILVIFVTPFVWMILGSLRNETEIFKYLYPFGVRTFVPVEWSIKNYFDILGLSAEGKAFGLNFGLNLFNSAITSAAVVASSLFFNTMGAYFFARLDFPHKNILLVFVIATMLIPFQATIVPLYIVVRALHLHDSYWTMIVPWYASPFVIFSLMQFFQEIPKELDEAAIIDGASYLGILRHVIVPNSVPGIVTNALLEFQFIWNLFYWPLVAVGRKQLQVVQVAIAAYTTQTQIFWGRTFAGSVLASLPVIILFLALQRYYVKGVVMSGMKG